MTNDNQSKRRSQRSIVTPFEIRGQMTGTDGHTSDVVLIWNISDNGLCIWGTSGAKPGDEVRLELTHPCKLEVTCAVRWSRKIPDHSGCLLGLEAAGGEPAFAAVHKAIQKKSQKAG